MSTSNKKHTFTYSPSQQDVDAYIKFKSGENKQRTYMKDYKSLHHIDGLSDNSILVYEAIRNLVGMYVLQQKYRESYKKQKMSKSGSIGTTRNNTSNSVVGTTMIITNPMLQEWIGDKSHNTIKSALEQLESMGFIKCSTDTTKKTGRKVTLLRDMEEYQPEEIKALEAYLKGMSDSQEIHQENKNEDKSNEEEKPKRKTVKKSEKSKNPEKSEEKEVEETDDDMDDDFDF